MCDKHVLCMTHNPSGEIYREYASVIMGRAREAGRGVAFAQSTSAFNTYSGPRHSPIAGSQTSRNRSASCACFYADSGGTGDGGRA